MVLSAIGDSILSSAIFTALKDLNPEIEIIVFVTSGNFNIYKVLEGVDKLVLLPIANPMRTLKLINDQAVDVLIDTSQWARIPAIYSALTNSYSIGFKTDGQFRHYAYNNIVRHSKNCHEIDNFLHLLKLFGVKNIFLPKINHKAINALPKFDIPSYFVLHPWAGGTKFEFREWPIENWAKVANFLNLIGYCVVISGGASDVVKTNNLMALVGDQARTTSVVGRFNLLQTANLIKNAKGVICVNTGIMHLAAILDTPLIALHGPTNYRRWGPIGANSINIAIPEEDGGAFLNLGFEYQKDSKYIMNKISVDSVIQTLHMHFNLGNHE